MIHFGDEPQWSSGRSPTVDGFQISWSCSIAARIFLLAYETPPACTNILCGYLINLYLPDFRLVSSNWRSGRPNCSRWSQISSPGPRLGSGWSSRPGWLLERQFHSFGPFSELRKSYLFIFGGLWELVEPLSKKYFLWAFCGGRVDFVTAEG